MKVLVHDGIGVWLAARRLKQGKFVWPRDAGTTLSLTHPQLDALVLGLPWQRSGYIPPAEAEANYYRHLASQTAAVAL